MIHRRGGCHRAWIKRLYLIRTEPVGLEPHRQVHHVFVAGTWVSRDKVRHQELFLTGLLTKLIKQLFELIVAANARLHHL